jgi:hypothetical protein
MQQATLGCGLHVEIVAVRGEQIVHQSSTVVDVPRILRRNPGDVALLRELDQLRRERCLDAAGMMQLHLDRQPSVEHLAPARETPLGVDSSSRAQEGREQSGRRSGERMYAIRMRRDVFPRHFRPAAAFGLRFFLPRLPLSHTRHRRQRGNVAVALLVAREKRGRIAVDVDLHANDRSHRILTATARLVAVLRRSVAGGILERRHRFDSEFRDRSQIGRVGDAEVCIAKRARLLRQRLRRNGAVGKGEAGVGAELDVHGLMAISYWLLAISQRRRNAPVCSSLYSQRRRRRRTPNPQPIANS